MTTKTVSFAPENDVQYFAVHQDKNTLWCSAEEAHEFKSDTKEHASKLRRQGVDRLLEKSFASATSDVQKCLNEFYKHTSGRGIERSISQKHFNERMQQRALAIKVILLGQEQARKQGLKLEDVSEQLRELSIRYCVNAKIFARRMGKADEYACKIKSSSCSSKNSASQKSKMIASPSKQQAVTKLAVAPSYCISTALSSQTICQQRIALMTWAHFTYNVTVTLL